MLRLNKCRFSSGMIERLQYLGSEFTLVFLANRIIKAIVADEVVEGVSVSSHHYRPISFRILSSARVAAVPRGRA